MSDVTRDQAIKWLEAIMESSEDLAYIESADGTETVLSHLMPAWSILSGDPDYLPNRRKA